MEARGREAGATVTASVSGLGAAVTASEPDWHDCTCRRRVSLLVCQHAIRVLGLMPSIACGTTDRRLKRDEHREQENGRSRVWVRTCLS